MSFAICPETGTESWGSACASGCVAACWAPGGEKEGEGGIRDTDVGVRVRIRPPGDPSCRLFQSLALATKCIYMQMLNNQRRR